MFSRGTNWGAAADYGIQVAANFIEGKDVKEALTDVDVT